MPHNRLCYGTNGGFYYECHCEEPPPPRQPPDPTPAEGDT